VSVTQVSKPGRQLLTFWCLLNCCQY